MNGVQAELTAIDDGDSHEDTRATADRDHKDGDDGSRPRMALPSDNGHDRLELLAHWLLTAASYNLQLHTRASEIPSTCIEGNTHHLLVLALLDNNAQAGAGHLNQNVREETRTQGL